MRNVASLVVGLALAATVPAQAVNVGGVLKYSPPPGFKRDDARAPGRRIAFWAPEVKDYSPSIMLTFHPAGDRTAAAIGRTAIASMSQEPDMKVVGYREAKVAGKPAFVFQIEIAMVSGDVIAQHLVYITHKRQLVSLTFQVLKGSSASLAAKFRNSLETIKYLK